MENGTFAGRWWMVCLAAVWLASCQESIPVGFDLIDEQNLGIEVATEFDLSTRTIAGERVITHRPGVDSKTYILGNLNDQVYGIVEPSLYLSFLLGDTPPDFSTVKPDGLDSLVLILEYDTTATYGQKAGLQEIEVFPLVDSLYVNDTIYSDAVIESSMSPVAKITRWVSPKDSVNVTDYKTKKSERQAPQLRIRLDQEFGRQLLSNLEANKSDAALRKFFMGLKIVSRSADNKPMLYGLNLNNSALLSSNPLNKLIAYYQQPSGDTTIRATYQYLIYAATANTFQHQYQGSVLHTSLQDSTVSQQVSFVQPMGGAKTRIRIHDLDKMKGKLINKAVLECFVADIPGPVGNFSEPPQLILESKNRNGQTVLLPDIFQLINNNVNFVQVFGGTLEKTSPVKKYTFSITNHVKIALRDSTYNSDMLLSILTESEIPNRVAIHGGKHATYPVRLKITYTKE
ncbi:MAG: DUF4270 domain-containing protein [Saprospiraceae bacterium]|nr:DUF4270 domain-containing protein [Saprospiraceae bacterium]